MQVDELRTKLIAEPVEVNFEEGYKYRMTYKGECEGVKFRISLHSYRYMFEPTEWSRDLLEEKDADLEIIKESS